MTHQEILSLASEQMEAMIGHRRSLHQIPELGHQVHQTKAYIERALDQLGIAHHSLGTAVVGIIHGRGDGPCVALRADVDALPTQEAIESEYKSRHPGRMHACGHDMHAAIQLGAAQVLSENRARYPGSVKLLFQPAEESEGGAQPMIEAGAMENPTVDAVYGLHVSPLLPTGCVETRPGALNAATDELRIDVHGQSGHGAYPESGYDAIVCAAQLVTALQTLVSRNLSPMKSSALSIGSIHGGEAPNILCDLVRLHGTLRTLEEPVRAMMKQRIEETVHHVCQAMRCAGEVQFVPGYPALINPPNQADLVLQLASELLGEGRALSKETPSMGGEDFSYFLAQAPGCFYNIGCARPGQALIPLHSSRFDPDENCLRIGAAMQIALALHHQNRPGGI